MSEKLNRREFLYAGGVECTGLLLGGNLSLIHVPVSGNDVSDLIDHEHIFEVKKTRHFSVLPNKKIRCELCPRKCEVDHLERGFCGVRENRDGTYYVLAYSNPCALHIDPIEKKPFFHFLPESRALSLATAGCNLICKFCQNWEISQFRPEQTQNTYLSPENIARMAVEQNVPIVAYTYAEPVIFYEYMYDCSVLGRKQGLKNVIVSAGYINEKPLRELVKVLDAVKIDLKAFTQKYYAEVCSSDLQPVLDTLQILKDEKIWFEIVYLVLPTLNDDLGKVKEMSVWLRDKLGTDVPLHYSRFYPTYMMKNLPPTPVSTLENMRKVSLDAGLHYVYIGNVPGHEAENTYCPGCGKMLIHRVGYHILEKHIKKGACEFCGEKIAGVWQ